MMNGWLTVNKKKGYTRPTEDNSIDRIKNYNHKSMLCQNIISKRPCEYGDKCLYAHSLDDQKLNVNKQMAYDIITGNGNLSYINLVTDKFMYKLLLQFTNLCKKCAANSCTGGYNCKYGACSEEYLVCKTDLETGDCEENDCKKVHLTHRGLVPHMKKTIPQGIVLTPDFFENTTTNDYEPLSDITNSDSPNENLLTKSIFT